MIVPESATPKSTPKVKGDREPLPDGQAVPPAYSQYPSMSFPIYPNNHHQVQESTAARFFKALIVACLIWFLFGMLTSSFVWIANTRHGHSYVSNYLLVGMKGACLMSVDLARWRQRRVPSAIRRDHP